jgi:hypothetical protein
MRIQKIVLAGAGLCVLCGCSGSSGSSPHPVVVQLRSAAKACQEFGSWYRQTGGDWAHADAAMLIVAGGEAPSGGRLYHDIGDLTSIVLFSSNTSAHPGVSQTVADDAQTVQQDCQPGSAASPPATLAGPAAANAKLLAQALAGDSASALSSLANQSVTGPVMVTYVRSEAVQDLALATAGQADPPETIAQVVGGWSMCPAQGNGGCDTLTGIKADSDGLLTDVLVDGLPVSSRLSVGTKSTGGGLTISWVAGYYVPSSDVLRVTFKVRDDGSAVSDSVSPAFVSSGGTRIPYDTSASLLPGPLRPGQTAEGVASFRTRAITGTFSLSGNGQTLVSTPLQKA